MIKSGIKAQQVFRGMPRTQKDLIKNKQSNFNQLAVQLVEKGLDKTFLVKVSKYKTYDQIISAMKNILKSSGQNFDKLKERLATSSDVEVVYENEVKGIILAQIYNYRGSRKFGNNNWCICYSEGYWRQYSSRGKQYFWWSFFEDNFRHERIGITLKNDYGYSTAHDINDSYVPKKTMTSILEEHRLDWSIFVNPEETKRLWKDAKTLTRKLKLAKDIGFPDDETKEKVNDEFLKAEKIGISLLSQAIDVFDIDKSKGRELFDKIRFTTTTITGHKNKLLDFYTQSELDKIIKDKKLYSIVNYKTWSFIPSSVFKEELNAISSDVKSKKCYRGSVCHDFLNKINDFKTATLKSIVSKNNVEDFKLYQEVYNKIMKSEKSTYSASFEESRWYLETLYPLYLPEYSVSDIENNNVLKYCLNNFKLTNFKTSPKMFYGSYYGKDWCIPVKITMNRTIALFGLLLDKGKYDKAYSLFSFFYRFFNRQCYGFVEMTLVSTDNEEFINKILKKFGNININKLFKKFMDGEVESDIIKKVSKFSKKSPVVDITNYPGEFPELYNKIEETSIKISTS